VRLWSDAFDDGEELPLECTKDGEDTSPPFRWCDLPDRTGELAGCATACSAGKKFAWQCRL
jgi:phosphatidylethanolamine-binding protein (PEBP) family uncharacterized protein